MTYIKKYLLPWLLALSVIFDVPLFFKSETTSDDAYYVVPILASLLALFCSGLYYFWDTRWGPEQRKKKMNKAPFTSFYQLGFDKKEDFAIGTIHGYQVIIRYNWIGRAGKPSISFETLFNPKKSGCFLHRNFIDELNKRYRKEKIDWCRNFLIKEWEFNFRPPAFESIYRYVQRSIELLKLERFEPLTLEQSEEMLPEFERYVEDKMNTKRKGGKVHFS